MGVIEETAFVDLDDEALLDLLGYLHEEIKRIDERMHADEHIERLEGELKAYKDEHYGDSKRAHVAKLKGVRAMAKARGLQFKLPGER